MTRTLAKQYDQNATHVKQDKLEDSMRTGILLASPTKGEMELIVGETWAMAEEGLPELSWVPDIDSMDDDQR